jgi:hypothetical protein
MLPQHIVTNVGSLFRRGGDHHIDENLKPVRLMVDQHEILPLRHSDFEEVVVRTMTAMVAVPLIHPTVLRMPLLGYYLSRKVIIIFEKKTEKDRVA